MKSLTLILAAASLLIVFITMPAKAGVEILNPYAGVVWKSGDNVKCTWKDNGSPPTLDTLTSLTFYLMAGTNASQFTVATIASGVAGTTLSLDYTVPSSLGPSGSFYFIKCSQGSYVAYSGDFTITGVSGTIPNFNPNDPGTPLTSSSASSSPSSTLSSSANSTSTASASASASNSAAKNSAASTKSGSSAATSQVLGSPTATSVSSSSTDGPANTPAPTSKSSDSNKLATNSYVLSLALFIIAFYLY